MQVSLFTLEGTQVVTGLVPLPQLLNVDEYNPNTLLETYKPRIQLKQRCDGCCRPRSALPPGRCLTKHALQTSQPIYLQRQGPQPRP
jgi:hypothetical protein